MQQTNEKIISSIRDPAMQNLIDGYNALRKAEISRIRTDFSKETLQQKVDRLNAWEMENDFIIKFVRPFVLMDASPAQPCNSPAAA